MSNILLVGLGHATTATKVVYSVRTVHQENS